MAPLESAQFETYSNFWIAPCMNRLTVEERIQIIKSQYKNADSAVSMLRTGSVTNILHLRNIRSAENIAVVAENVKKDQNM